MSEPSISLPNILALATANDGQEGTKFSTNRNSIIRKDVGAATRAHSVLVHCNLS